MEKISIRKSLSRDIYDSIFLLDTDTILGISCFYNDSKSYENIFKIKNRDKKKDLIVLCSSVDQVKDLCELSTYQEKILINNCPGKVTYILNSKINPKKIAIRIPNNKSLRIFLEKKGPVYSTSYNISGQLSNHKINKNMNEVNKKIKYYIYNKKKVFNVFTKPKPSKIVDISNDDFNIIRK